MKCHEVDTIYFPINQPNEHWFLGVVRLNEWSIHRLDSLYTARKKQARLDVVRPLTEMLPHALEDVKFFDFRPELVKSKGIPLIIVYEKKYPQQSG